MRAFCVAILALFAASVAAAESEARQGADWVRIFAEPCVNEKVLANIAGRGETPEDYRAARAEFRGAPYAACWRPDFQRRVIELRYDDNDKGEVPFADMKPVKTV